MLELDAQIKKEEDADGGEDEYGDEEAQHIINS